MSDPAPKTGALRTMLTEDAANLVWDPLRLGFVATMAVAIFIVLALAIALLWCVITRQPLPERIGEYCTGVGVILAGIGTLIGGTGAGLFAAAKAPSS